MEFLLRKPSFSISCEMIEFQSEDFKLQLTSFYDGLIQGMFDGKLNQKKAAEELEMLLFNRFGLKFDVKHNSALAAILPFYSNKNHIFIHKMWRGQFSIRDQEAILKQAQGKKGWVDDRRAKVGGLFSENINLLYLNFEQLVKTYKLSAAEMAAVTLHEIGHAYYACSYADRLESMNQVLANIAKVKDSKKDGKVVYVYNEAKKINPEITEEDIQLILGENRVIAGAKWFKFVVGAVKTQMNHDKYDETSFEQMADNFATRFGLGREILTALDKLSLLHGAPERNQAVRVLFIIQDLALFVAMAGFVVLGSVPGVIFTATLAVLRLLLEGDGARDMTYDDLKQRYTRIRHQLIELLKEAKASPLEQRAVLDDLAVIDEVLENTKEYSGIFKSLANLFFPFNRRAKTSIEEQQLLESLANNELFVASARLKTL